jgi:hypothetical protein
MPTPFLKAGGTGELALARLAPVGPSQQAIVSHLEPTNKYAAVKGTLLELLACVCTEHTYISLLPLH